jgi:hypothetical protein
MGYRKESCHLRKCLIMLGIISSRKALPCSHQQQGEYKCLKREFLQSASSNLEGRSVHTSRWIWEYLRGDLTWHQVKRTGASTSAHALSAKILFRPL